MFRKKKSVKTKPSHEDLGKMLQNIYDTGYIDHNTAYKMSFLKGVVAGFGGVVGATLVVALFIWTLSLFSDVPLIDKVQETLQTNNRVQNP